MGGDAPGDGRAASRRVAWPPERWPERDQCAWRKALAPGDFLDDAGKAAGWAGASRHSAVGAWGRWLAFLDRKGLLDRDAEPAGRMTPALLDAYLDELRAGHAPVTVASYIGLLEMMVQALAPDADWRWMRKVQARLQRRAEPVRDKRGLIVPIGDLAALGADLMEQADAAAAEHGMTLATALAHRDGLIIAVLARRPWRVRNLMSIEVGRHLVPDGEGYVVRFEAAETKGGRALESVFPADLLPALKRYLDVCRPCLLAARQGRGASRQGRLPPAGNHLWLNQYGGAMGAQALTDMLRKHTTARFGHPVNPHLFRDCVASSVATNDPHHVRMAAQLLGHADFRTTEKHYIHAKQQIAALKFQQQIDAIRNAGDKTRRERGGG